MHPRQWDPEATTLLPPTGAEGSDATTVLPPVAGADPEATTVLPPLAGGTVPGADPAAPLDATRAMPPVVDEPYPGAPAGPAVPGPRTGGRRAARRRRQKRRSHSPLPWVALAACAAVGLAIGGVLSLMDGGNDTAAAVASTPAPVAPTPTVSAAPDPETDTTTVSTSSSPADAEPTSTAPPVPSGRFVLVDPATGRAVDIEAESVEDGAPAILWDRHGGPNQQWFFSDLGDGHVQIRAAHSDLCLAGADPRGPGAAVVQRPCAPDNIAQRWQPTAPAASGPHTLTLQGTGLVLAPAAPDGGAPLQLRQPDPSTAQGWSLEAAA
ncbi:RICIN domain-containing protein [Streptomyces sp. MUM 203J]|uniref:RICIN domain-containing protein n=1 Tax=Streptomyces sp. MUM 203J TaxID=2791990 RepID=UPI001F036E66|nr:RICIN domain-containing protein [Streptomyces sp. MUM 203J]MCH0543348.1 RICIN domain-containing protein [Streptomyces sp. MUM 203J]